MIIGSTRTIPAGEVGFVLPVAGHQFLLTGAPTAIRRIASIVADALVVADGPDVGTLSGVAIDEDEIATLGDATMGVGTGRGSDYVTGHYLAIVALRRLISAEIDSRRLPSVQSA